jgi:hypothetical protein
MVNTHLGRYAAMQKKNAVAAVLDFKDEEWESLKQLKEDNMMRGMTNPSEERNNNNNGGGLGAENGANGDEINEEAVSMHQFKNLTLLPCVENMILL